MPSALETLVKILKLEREQGCDNRAVIGGLTQFSANWHEQAQSQARRPEHFVLADEIVDILREYDEIDNKTERLRQINYILDRVVGREPMPEKYAGRMSEAEKRVAENKRQRRKKLQEKGDDRKNSGKRQSNNKSRRASSNTSAYNTREHNENYDNSDYTPADVRSLDLQPLPKLDRPPRPRSPQPLETALDQLQQMEADVVAVKGVGKSIAEKLAQLDLYTVRDLLFYLPRRYDDYTRLGYISKLMPDNIATVIGTIADTQVRVGASGRKDFYMRVEDGSGSLDVTFFGQHFLVRSLRKGRQVVLSGKVTRWRDRLQMTNPEWEYLDSDNLHTVGIVPVYGMTEGLKARSFRRMMKRLIDDWSERIPDHIPPATLERAEMGDLGWTLKNLHFPEGHDHLEHARRRFIFDQLLTLQLGILGNRREWQSVPGVPLDVTDDFLETFIDTTFPFPLTGAQNRAIADIRADVTQPIPMNRLIQGDVGSGKTAVAVTALAMAVTNGKQGAMMAPTSILAEQHYRGISDALSRYPGDQKPVIALLTSALTTSERQSIYRGMADGSIDIVIGTHALIQEGVEFNDLAVAIVDEQHRFGVQQRGALRGKGSNPHLLVMTATPIPRTLALTMYADLDLSIIDEKPPGRQPITTRMLQPVERERAFSFIQSQLEQGRQAFIIHPLVEASEKIEARSAVEAYEELTVVFHRHRVCLLHGRMSPSEKDEIMAAFAHGEYDVMVTTSVAEVGVDVPNASVILIEGANRFGLAQLHQFRGRVGRGQHQSYCLLIPDNDTPESQQRLSAMEATDDGFKLAEMDWKMRGAGDLLGTRQSGGHVLQLAEAMTPELVTLARREAQTIYAEDPSLAQEAHALLARRVTAVHNPDGDVS